MVKPKKFLGQHFLKDENIAQKIVSSLLFHEHYKTVLEIGPGTGVLTKYILKNKSIDFVVDEVDPESREFLSGQYPALKGKILDTDFLKLNLEKYFDNTQIGIIGNFPYNISSQIFFQILKYRHIVPECVGMIQKEVGQRICSAHGSKEYGILSVLLQTFYEVEYLFDVGPKVFNPPPKVWSCVIRLKRKAGFELNMDESLFFKIVKQAFQTRRKTLRNSLKSLNLPDDLRKDPVFDLRAEQLSIAEFLKLSKLIESAL